MMNNEMNLDFFDGKEDHRFRERENIEPEYDDKLNLENTLNSSKMRSKYKRHSLLQIQNLEA